MSRFTPPRILGLTILSDKKQPNLAYKGGYDIVSLQILKAICAFFVVQIHTESFFKPYIMPICRIAVPLFFMITGYFLLNKDGILTTDKLKRTFIKILKVTITANLFYFAFKSVALSRHPGMLQEFIQSTYTWKTFFIIGNTFCGALWYMTALLQALFVFLIFTKLKLQKWIPLIACFGLVLNILLGEFHILDITANYFNPHRNFFTIAIPCMYIGMLIRLNEHRLKIKSSAYIVFAVTTIALLYIERIVIAPFDAKITGDIQIFTIPLAITIYLIFLTFKANENLIAKLGRNHSSNIYIYHEFVNISINAAHLRFESLACIEVFIVTLALSVCGKRVKQRLTKNA